MKKLVAVAAAIAMIVILVKNGYLGGSDMSVQDVVDGFKASGYYEVKGGEISQGGYSGEVAAARVILSGTPVRIMYFDNSGKLSMAKSSMNSGPGAMAVANAVGVTTTLGIQSAASQGVRRWTHSRGKILLMIETNDESTKDEIVKAFMAM